MFIVERQAAQRAEICYDQGTKNRALGLRLQPRAERLPELEAKRNA